MLKNKLILQMKKMIILMLFSISITTFSQKKLYYNLAINNCTEKSFDAIINKCIKSSYLLDYEFKTSSGELVSTDKIKKPILIVAGFSRVAPFIAYIPALNQLAEKHSDKIEILVIFLDEEEGINRVAKRFNSKIKLIPSTKKLENKAHIESYGFIHKLDYPTTYFIGKDKQFKDVKRGAISPSKKISKDEATKKNLESLEAFLLNNI